MTVAPPSIERLALRSLLSLPRPVLRLLAGGGVVYRGGRTLDPRFQLLAALAARRPALTTFPPQEARRLSAVGGRAVSGTPEAGVRTESLTIDGPRGPVAARVYRPEEQDAMAPVMVYGHSGGGVLGDLETSDVFCRILAKVGRCPVVSVAYGLAPEERFPAGLEDMTAAYLWTRDNAARFGGPPGAAAVGGDSMGAAFAAVIAQEMKRRREPQPALQLLIYPALDVASEAASMTTYADAFPLSRAAIDWFTSHYVGPEADPADPRLSPIRETDLSGLAPAIVVTAGFDPLLDQGEAYAHRLRQAGTPVCYRCYDSLPHGFALFTGVSPSADVACREIAGLVREGLEGRIH
jgi:acetyl esterase/lipase